MSTKLWGLLACSENLAADVKRYETLLGLPARDEWNGCQSFALGTTKLYLLAAPSAAPIMVLQTADLAAETKRLRQEGFAVEEPFAVRAGSFAFCQDQNGAQHGLLQPAAAYA